jgi:hypothetical protein
MVIHLVRRALVWALSKIESKKQEALVHVPAVSGTWLQVADGSIVRSYKYKCNCGQNYEYGADEAHVTKLHTCECCKREFSLLCSIDALEPDGRFKSDLAIRLSSLAIQRVNREQQPRTPFLPVDWGYSTAGEVIWTGEKPASGVQWK